MSYKIILLLFAYRILMAYFTQNYEYPDEYWQGPQVAHRLHYGYGYLTWQWTISEPLRNPTYPYLLSLAYYVIDLLQLQEYAYHGPRYLIQVPIAVLTDLYLLKILRLLYSSISVMMLACVFTNWYYASTMIRTYFNSFETALTVISFYYWISNTRLGSSGYKDFMNRAIATINYVSRPTSIMVWALLWPYELYNIIRVYGLFSGKVVKFIAKNIITICFMVWSSFIVGTIFNGKMTLTQLNFIKYNFIQKWSQLYGQQSKLFYYVLTLPFTINIGLALLLISIIRIQTGRRSNYQLTQANFQHEQNKKFSLANKNFKTIVGFSFVYLLLSSLSTHKQHRFILPIIPFLLIIMPYCLKQGGNFILGLSIPKKLLIFIATVIILINIGIFAAFNVYGKSDGITAWKYIDQRMNGLNLPDNQTVVVVLGESHFMPGYSMLHKNITYRIPDSSAIKMSTNSSENLLLATNPHMLYNILTENKKLKPHFVIAQGKYLPFTAHLLVTQGYRQVKMWRHCTIPQQAFLGYDSISIFELA